jgi:DNA-binding SARP family transcriptional activator/Tfp pilus assembly protein PilF
VAAELEFCLLGALVVRSGPAVLAPVGKQRIVLAALLLNAGRSVSVDELIEVLWADSPPPSARVAAQNYVMRLRNALGNPGRSRIITQPHGYLIRVEAGELDVSRFETLLGAARAAARDGRWDQAATHARAALGLWRGEPLADVNSEVLAAREVPRLVELRLQALEVRIDSDLHLGRQAEALAELRQLVARYPLREHLHGLLMLALYRDDRQAEALAAYREARRVLVEELGAEPGIGLRELHQRMLVGDTALAVTDPVPPATGPAVPRELPAGIAHFTGRTSELAALNGLLDTAGDQMPGTVVSSAIGGTAGVGKTALAVQWAHQSAGRFPDGQLYVDLRGYAPGEPVTPADALAGFLHSLGVAGQDIPAEEADRAARYRSLLAGRRMLVVLDNAGSAEQVRPLLPGDPACVVVVTSRDALAGLVARDGARRLDLDLLPLEDAVSLLRALIGARVDADPAAAALLAAQCCRLPLALRVAAELVIARAEASVAGLVHELADQRRRLDLLDAGGDTGTAVRAVFSWSYRSLAADAARALRLAGLHPGPDLDRYGVAALADTDLEQAGRLLGVLARAHLIQQAGPGRWSMHDLLRAYALDRAAAEDEEAERQRALTRLFEYYLGTAAAAMDTLFPAEADRRPRIPAPASPAPPVAEPAAARAWLDAERATLVDVAAYTTARGWPGHTTRLAATVFRYLEAGGYYREISAIQGQACRAARDVGDQTAEARALSELSVVDLRQGRYRHAAEKLMHALTVCRRVGDRPHEARALGNLGIAEFLQGQYPRATGHYQQALAVYYETGDRAGACRALNNLGLVELRQGRYEQARDHLGQALALCRQTGNQAGEANALSNLGLTDLRLGRLQQARDHLGEAVALCRETGNRASEAYALSNLGLTDLRLGRLQRAHDHLGQALALCRQTGDQSSEAEVLNGLGEVCLAAGRSGQATEEHAAALGLASQLGDKYEQARAHNGLAHSHHADDDPRQAHHHWKEALALYTELGTPEADQVRVQLTKAAADKPRQP